MSDADLIAWLNAGAHVPLSPEEQASRQATEFVARFSAALDPAEDLGPTDELHQAAIARAVYAIHRDLNALGEEAYSNVWTLLAAPVRRAIKAYVAMGRS